MFKQIIPAFRATVVLAIITGLLFPLVITTLAQIFFPHQANGSLIATNDGRIIGSKLIGQSFRDPRYFHPRPSAAGTGYAGESSGGTNLGPTSAKLILGDKNSSFNGVKQLVEHYQQENQLPSDKLVPVDAVTYSASGLDPHISVSNALLQAPRVASVRVLPLEQVHNLIRQYTEGRQLGILGEPSVNVLMLNLAMDAHR